MANVNLVDSSNIKVTQSSNNISLDFGSETVVDSIRTKNMFNKDSGFRRGYIGTDNSFTSDTATASFYQYIPCKPNTTYTISFNTVVRSIGSPVYYDSSKTFISRETTVNQASGRTITTPANCYYMVIQFSVDENAITQAKIDSVNCQLEEGSTATTYAPYQNLTGQEFYSKGEIKIGTWIDGKTLYRKCFEIPTTTISSGSATVININTGTINVVDVRGYVYVATSSFRYSINGCRTQDYGWRYDVAHGGMQLVVGTSLSAEGTISGVAIVEYTKN